MLRLMVGGLIGTAVAVSIGVAWVLSGYAASSPEAVRFAVGLVLGSCLGHVGIAVADRGSKGDGRWTERRS